MVEGGLMEGVQERLKSDLKLFKNRISSVKSFFGS